jgi:DoxX-like family
MPDHKLIRLSIAAVWFYQGLWCKVLGGVPRQEAVISTVPFLGAGAVRMALVALGLVECGLAVWVLSGQRMRQAAMAQTALLAAMNSGGLIWAWHLIPDPAGMIVQNFAFLVLIWIASEDHRYAAHA